MDIVELILHTAFGLSVVVFYTASGMFIQKEFGSFENFIVAVLEKITGVSIEQDKNT